MLYRAEGLSAQIEYPGRDEIALLADAKRDRRSKALDVSPPLGRSGTAKPQFLPAPKSRSRGAIDGHDRDFGEACLQRQNGASHQIRVIRQTIEGSACIDRKRADAGPAQFDHMSVAAERAAEIPRDRAHVGALTAFGLQHRVIGLSRYQFEPVDMDRARFNLEGFAVAREVVGARTRDADGGEGRRGLPGGADGGREEA